MYANVGIVSPGVCALAIGTSINDADIESMKNIAIAIAPVLLLKDFINLLDIYFSPFSMNKSVKIFIFKTLPDCQKSQMKLPFLQQRGYNISFRNHKNKFYSWSTGVLSKDHAFSDCCRRKISWPLSGHRL